jgi:cellobiose PTS system EIIB component
MTLAALPRKLEMAILMYMPKTYSIAQARDRLPRLVRDAERGAEVELTRRGEKVAVLVSIARLETGAANFWDRLVAFRKSATKSGLLPRSALARLRDRSPGRRVKL